MQVVIQYLVESCLHDQMMGLQTATRIKKTNWQNKFKFLKTVTKNSTPNFSMKIPSPLKKSFIGSSPQETTLRAQTASNVSSETAENFPKLGELSLPPGRKQDQYEWLKEKILNCSVCQSHVKPGKKIVCGVGNLEASIFFCGEAPGADEEIQGEPFVGRAGQLLTKMIQAMGLSREEVYIANIMNWRPEMPTEVGNRPPTLEEMQFCLPYLRAQVKIVQPRVIVALGATAVKGLLNTHNVRMGEMRGQWSQLESIPLMITFHPSYLLRNATMATKRAVWEDLLKVMEKVQLSISDKQRGFFLPKE